MEILNFSFNKQVSHMVCCTENGYHIYALNPKIIKIASLHEGNGFSIAKMLGITERQILVGGGKKPFCSDAAAIIWNVEAKTEMLQLIMKEKIYNILYEEDKIVVIFEKKIYVLNEHCKLDYAKSTFLNKDGLCTITKNATDQKILTLGPQLGEVAIWDTKNNKNYKIIKAHNSNITAIAINPDGTRIATGSETGTLIKVFDISGTELHTFRRGSTTTKIYSLAFNSNSTHLACCSGNGTIHIFDLNSDPVETKNIKSMLYSYKNILPEYFSSEWSCRKHYISSKEKMICEFDDGNILHVVTLDGKYYRIFGDDYGSINEVNLSELD